MKKKKFYYRDFKGKIKNKIKINIKIGVSVFVLPLIIGGGVALYFRRKASND